MTKDGGYHEPIEDEASASSEFAAAANAGRWRVASYAAIVSLAMAATGSMWAVVSARDDARASLAAPAQTPSKPRETIVDEPASVAPAAELQVLKLLPPPPPPPITLVLNADLSTQRLTVLEDGKPKYTWPISSGKSGFATKTGTFTPQWASRLWYSRQYENAPMPHAVFFHKGMAFHATTAVRMLGRPASHGCIRLSPSNAALLFKLVHKHGFTQTRIVVRNGSKGEKSPVARKTKPSRDAQVLPVPARKGRSAG